MKAVILAGGEGTRLRPLTLHKPKPMVPLFDKPVLEYTLEHLKKNGITEMAATLQTLPHVVTDYFGNGSAHGVVLKHYVERLPLGTAGAVRACSNFLDGDRPFVVISGDGVCNFDLRAALSFHRERKADATILLHRQQQVQSYGLVMTDRQGRVTRFIEKPSWGQVFADTVNTGIYIIEPRVLQRIPENTFYDFARDLFPLMLNKGGALYGYAADGYWCDIGDTGAYLQCVFDVLDGKLDLGLRAARVGPGIRSESFIPAGTQLLAPCYIGSDVQLGQGVRIGPYAVVTGGAVIGDGAVIERSCIDGAVAGAHSDITGAVVCRGSHIGQGARLHEGCVIGEGANIGAHAVVQELCRVWPGKDIEPGARASGSITAGVHRRSTLFDGAGRISGQLNIDLPPDLLLRLGAAIAVVAGGPADIGGHTADGDIAVGWQGGDAARVAAGLVEAGVTAAGCNAVRYDAGFPACAAFVAGLYRFPMCLFVSQSGGNLKLFIYGPDGLPIERSVELRIESIAARGEVTYREARAVGSARSLAGMTALYELTASGPSSWHDPRRPFSVMVRGGGTAAQSLSNALRSMGCDIRPESRLPMFEVDDDGFTVMAIDERERVIPHERLLCMLCLYEASQGNDTLAVPYTAPMLLDYMGRESGMKIRRAGRDSDARSLLSEQPFLRDGIFLLTRLAQALMTSGLTLSFMNDELPPFFLSSVDVVVGNDKGAVMRMLAEGCEPESSELVEGLRTHLDNGWVHVAPLPGRRALRITGESATEEMAAELCHMFHKRAMEADRK